MSSTDIIAISHHEAREQWRGCHCHPERDDLLQSELIIRRFISIDSAAAHIAKLDIELDEHNERYLEWEHRVITSDHFDDKVIEERWSTRFNTDVFDDDFSVPDMIRDKAMDLRDEAKRKRQVEKDEQLRIQAAAKERQLAAEKAAREAKERAEYERLRKQFENK